MALAYRDTHYGSALAYADTIYTAPASITASAAWTEGSETIAASGAVAVAGAIAIGWTEGRESIGITGSVSPGPVPEIPPQSHPRAAPENGGINGSSTLDGGWLSGIEHLKQSITDILTTPLGSRVMRREYGSRLFALVDAPLNLQTLADIRAATVDAISRWEPRLKVQKVDITTASPGAVEMDLTGIYLPNGEAVTLKGIVVK